MAQTKLDLSDNKFAQLPSEVLHLSGCTHVFGQFQLESGSTISILSDAGEGKVLTSDGLGNGTWQISTGGIANAGNGLTKIGSTDVVWGGALTGNTCIGIDIHNLYITGGSNNFGIILNSGYIALGDNQNPVAPLNYMYIEPLITELYQSDGSNNYSDILQVPSYLQLTSYDCITNDNVQYIQASYGACLAAFCTANSCQFALTVCPSQISLGDYTTAVQHYLLMDSGCAEIVEFCSGNAYSCSGKLGTTPTESWIAGLTNEGVMGCIDICCGNVCLVSRDVTSNYCADLCISSDGGMLIGGYNATGFSGARYCNDYSLYFTARSIPDAQWVTGQTLCTLAKAITGGTNGLHIDGSNPQHLALGGRLCCTTSIDVSGNTFLICGAIGVCFIKITEPSDPTSTMTIDSCLCTSVCSKADLNIHANCNLCVGFNGTGIITDSTAIPLGLQYAGDYSATFCNNSLVTKLYVDTHTSSGGTSASGQNIAKLICQISHGFVVGDVIGFSGSTYNKAIADGLYNGEVLGLVNKCYNADCFDLVQAGYVTGLTSLSANTTYFLSTVTPGLLTDINPTGDTLISKAVIIATSESTGWVLPYPGYIVTTGSTGSGISLANNGLTTDGTTVCLGGTLIQNTIFDGGASCYNLRYAGDYSTNYTNRSLVDAAYVTGKTNASMPLIAKINVVSGTTYTIQSSDLGKNIEFTNTGTTIITLPTGFTVGFQVVLINIGGGDKCMTAGAGATLYTLGNKIKISGAYNAATAYYREINKWVAFGNLS